MNVIKKFFNIYFYFTCKTKLGIEFNVLLIKILTKIPYLCRFSEPIIHLFQNNYVKNHAAPVIKLAKLKNYTRFFVNVMDWGGARLYFYRQYHEHNTHNFIESNLTKGDTFIDVGANFGLYTFLAAKKVGSNGKVFSFEANPDVCSIMKQSIIFNNLENVVTIENLAVSDTSGELVPFYIPVSKVGSTMGTLISYDENEVNAPIKINVNAITLDDYLREISTTGNLYIKVDVEGVEERVVKGMIELLSSKKPYCIIVESNNPQSNACKMIESFGYKLTLAEIFIDNFGNYIFLRNR